MAERAKSDEINREALVQFAIRTIGSRRTPFFMAHSEFAIKSANLANDLFLSRRDSEYICRMHCEDIMQQSDIIWAATLLSHLCETTFINYDDVCDLTNPAVAAELHWILPDKTISLLEGTSRVLTQLARINNIYECGPIFAVLAKAITTAEGVGDAPSTAGFINPNIITSFSTSLWSAGVILQQLKIAQVDRWSDYVYDKLENAIRIATCWEKNGECPSIGFRSGETKHGVEWRFDMSIPDRKKDVVHYEEW